MRPNVVLVATAFGLAAMAGAQGANLIKDGGFESPAVPVGSLTRFDTGDKIGPWTVVGASGTVDLISKSYTYDGFTFLAKAGINGSI